MRMCMSDVRHAGHQAACVGLPLWLQVALALGYAIYTLKENKRMSLGACAGRETGACLLAFGSLQMAVVHNS